MTVHSAYDVAGLTYAAGFRGADWARAISVVLAESSGNDQAHNTTGGNDARGLMGINVKSGAHPEWTSRNLYDPKVNVATGYELFRRDGWKPWNSSIVGQAVNRLPATAAALAWQASHPGAAIGNTLSPSTNMPDTVPGTPPQSGDSLLQIANRAGHWITSPQNLLRIVYVAMGATLVIAALVVVASGSKTVQTGTKLASKGAL